MRSCYLLHGHLGTKKCLRRLYYAWFAKYLSTRKDNTRHRLAGSYTHAMILTSSLQKSSVRLEYLDWNMEQYLLMHGEDSILKTRLRTIGRLLEYPYQRVDEYLKSNKTSRSYCCTFAKDAHSKDAARCDAVCFGSLIFALQKRGHGLQKTDATAICDSVESLSKSLDDIVVCGLGNTQEQYSLGVCEHSYCTNNKYFRLFAEAHVKNIRSFVPESHQRHMKQKRAELYDKQPAHRKRQMPQEPTASKRRFSRLDADE